MSGKYEHSKCKIIGTITAKKNPKICSHQVGDRLELDYMNTAGLCGAFYHTIFPTIFMLQFGGNYPEDWGDKGVLSFDCPDRNNAVTIELRKVRKEEKRQTISRSWWVVS